MFLYFFSSFFKLPLTPLNFISIVSDSNLPRVILCDDMMLFFQLLLLSQADKALEETEWLVARMKGNISNQTTNDDAGMKYISNLSSLDHVQNQTQFTLLNHLQFEQVSFSGHPFHRPLARLEWLTVRSRSGDRMTQNTVPLVI